MGGYYMSGVLHYKHEESSNDAKFEIDFNLVKNKRNIQMPRYICNLDPKVCGGFYIFKQWKQWYLILYLTYYHMKYLKLNL